MISLLGSFEEDGIYAVSYKLATQISKFRNVSAMAFLPLAVKYLDTDKINGRDLVRNSISFASLGFILAILFGLSLFFFRGSSRYSNLFNSDNVIASISGTPISTNKFTRTLQLNINQFSNTNEKKKIK